MALVEAPNQRFFLQQHRVVNAGAGTGKTHALLTQYLHLLSGLSWQAEPLEPHAICALTFTEKAAGEMRQRLSRRLLDIVRVLSGSATQQLFDVEPDLLASAKALGRELPPLRHFESARAALSSAPIGTFHAFAAGLLRRHAVAAALDPDFALLDEDSARDLLEETCERSILTALEGQHGPNLATDAAQLVAEYGFRESSRAGGGLIEALCRLHLLRAEEGLSALGLSAAYSPAQLAREQERLRHELGDGLRALWQMSETLTGKSAERAVELGSHAAEIAQRMQPSLPVEDGLFAVLPFCETMSKELGRLRAPKNANGDDGPAEALRALCASLKQAASEVHALLRSHRAAPLAQAIERLLSVVGAAYDTQKRAASALDFTDLLSKARDLLRDHATVRESERRRYTALLVDEFQDTSPLQAELLRLLVGVAEAPASFEEPRRLYIVGDRKQSIYGFRGADVSAYKRLCDELLAAGAEEETLNVSRRSRPALLRSTNALFADVFAAPTKSATDSNEVGHIAWDEKRDPLQPFRQDPEASSNHGPLVELLHPAPTSAEAPTVDDPLGSEAQLLAKRITALRETGVRYGEIVILLRRYTHLLRYTTALKQAAIPHYVVRGRGFHQALEVLDLAAFLTLLDDSTDRLALLSVLRSPLCGLSDESLVQLHLARSLALGPLLEQAAARESSVPFRLALPRDESARLFHLLLLFRALERSADRIGPAACLRALLDHTDYLGVLYADPDGKQRVANVLRLCERARDCENRGGNLRSFVRTLRKDTDPRLSELRSERDEPTAPIASEAEDVVRVMTIHQSKGLEFPVVIVPGCATIERTMSSPITYDRAVGLGLKIVDQGERVDTLASRRARELGQKRSVAESDRLFYVAATRARDRLIFAGEVRRGKKTSINTWRFHIEALFAAQPELIAAFSPAPNPRAEALSAALPSGLDFAPQSLPAAERLVARVYGLGNGFSLACVADAVPLHLAAATDLLVCPRRFHLRHMLHLHEQLPALPPGRDEDAIGELPLGTLAAQVLDEIELTKSQPPLAATLFSALALRGHDIQSLQLRELVTRIERFVHSRYAARVLFAPGAQARVRRAVPYDVPIAESNGSEAPLRKDAVPRLRGMLDLAVFEPKNGITQAVEYRYGYAPEQPSALDTTRQRLLGMAFRRLLNQEQFATPALDGKLLLGTCYLRENDPQPRFIDVTDKSDDSQLAKDLRQAAPLFRLGQTAALQLPILPQKSCAELRCGYAFVCHAGAK